MSFYKVLRATFFVGALCILLLNALAVQPALAAVPGPTVISPSDGGMLDYGDDITVRVQPVSGASGYRYGFFQGGGMVWENYADERHLSGTEHTEWLVTVHQQRVLMVRTLCRRG
jgi:hypothetical protein